MTIGRPAIFGTLCAIAILTALTFAFHNCGSIHITHQSFPPIGQEVELPVVSESAKTLQGDEDYAHVLIFLSAGGRMLDFEEPYHLQFFSSEQDEEPFFEMPFAELMETFYTTNCPRHLKRYLENAFTGDALFCNHSVDLTEVHMVKAVSPDRTRMATSYSVEFVNISDQVLAVSFTLD